MFKKIFNIFSDTQDKNNMNLDAIFAGLLVRAAKVDNEYTTEEQKQIEKILQKEFNISAEKAKKMRILGENIEEATTDTVQITREIKKEIPFEKRKELAENLWSIILTDKFRSDEENSFMRTCVKLIGVNDVDSAIARKMVMARNEKTK